MEKITYQVRGLSCNACVNRVKNALQPYANEVNVTLKPPQAILQNPSANLTTLNAALQTVGHYVLDENFPKEKLNFWQTLKNKIYRYE